MKHILSLFFCLVTILSFSQVKNDTFKGTNYNIQYPSTWSLDTSKLMGTSFFLFSPLENKEDKFKENVNLLVQDLGSEDIGIRDYKEITENQFKQLPSANIKVFESSIQKGKKKDFYKVSYAMTQNGFRLKIYALCYIQDNKAYLLTFSAELNKYEKFKTVGEEIVNSFRLIN